MTLGSTRYTLCRHRSVDLIIGALSDAHSIPKVDNRAVLKWVAANTGNEDANERFGMARSGTRHYVGNPRVLASHLQPPVDCLHTPRPRILVHEPTLRAEIPRPSSRHDAVEPIERILLARNPSPCGYVTRSGVTRPGWSEDRHGRHTGESRASHGPLKPEA